MDASRINNELIATVSREVDARGKSDSYIMAMEMTKQMMWKDILDAISKLEKDGVFHPESLKICTKVVDDYTTVMTVEYAVGKENTLLMTIEYSMKNGSCYRIRVLKNEKYYTVGGRFLTLAEW